MKPARVRQLFALFLAALAALWSAPALAKETLNPNRQILVMVRHPPDHYRPNGDYAGYGDQLARSARERLARRIASRYALTLIDEWPMPMIGLDCFVMAVPEGRSTKEAASQVAQDAQVAWTEPVELYGTQETLPSHNDPLFPAEPAARQWRLAELHQIATGRGITIAVIDSGIDAAHPDLAGQVLLERNFVARETRGGENHGTGVAGIIAAKANNGVGIAGVAPDSRLLALRACWQASSSGATLCDSFSLAKAIYFAIQQKADVINLSLSGPEDRLLGELLKTALTRGSAIVAAFDRKRPRGGFPASFPGVIAVSDAFSGSDVYIAPGRDVPTTQPGGRWFLVNGSSYAAAHVSGLAALVWQRRRSANLTLVAARGQGRFIDACATLVRVASGCDCSCGGVYTARVRSGR